MSDDELRRRIIEQAESLFGKTGSGLLVAPGATPLMKTIQMSGRRMGKTTMAKVWVEEYQKAAARTSKSPEEFNKEYLGDFSAATTASSASIPWATKSAEEILTDVKRVAADIEPCRWTPAINKATIAGGMVTAAKIGDSPMGILDSTAGAAAGLAREMKGNEMDDTTKKQLEGIGAALMHRNAAGGSIPMFRLTGPMQLTIKTRQSQYKKKAFLGDETFTLSSHYIGKKDMILVFKNTRPVDYAFMEMPLDEALTALNGFKEFADAAGGGDIHGTLANIETMKTQERRAEQAVLMQDPEFASW
ncbi:hypothetical protein AB6809_29770 [Paraburkholderia sp. RCC_158]|uniref:hypothetical protein n=1 Tax=Paraburkholderia sp. RCC_158 TaxID=3239220 RepID=UPI003525BC74